VSALRSQLRAPPLPSPAAAGPVTAPADLALDRNIALDEPQP
jgi:hypothetical protein